MMIFESIFEIKNIFNFKNIKIFLFGNRNLIRFKIIILIL